VTGKGFRPRPVRLGAWRLPALAAVLAYVAVAAVLPLLVLLYVSTQPFYSSLSLEGLSQMSLESYRQLLGDEQVLGAARNSLLLGVGCATAVMLSMAVVSWLLVRTRIRGRWLVDGLAFLPIAIPGLVLGVALLIIYLRAPVPVYGTLWILFIAYFTRFMPYGIRSSSISMAQVGRELEESAQVCGASWWSTFRRVLLPLMLPGLVAGWIYIMLVSLRELSTSILLYSPGNEVLSIVIWERYENGAFPELAALGMLMVLVTGALAAAAYRLSVKRGIRGV
jgi:iron(III) transport system permease protein